jgi:hypothetical protein
MFSPSAAFSNLLFPQAMSAKYQSFGPIGGYSPFGPHRGNQISNTSPGFQRLSKTLTMEMLETSTQNKLNVAQNQPDASKQNGSKNSIQNPTELSLPPFKVMHPKSEPFPELRKQLECQISKNRASLLAERLEADRRQERIRQKRQDAEEAKAAKERMYKELKQKYQQRLEESVHGKKSKKPGVKKI